MTAIILKPWRTGRSRSGLLFVGVLLLAGIAGLLAWLVLGGTSSSTHRGAINQQGVQVSGAGLQTLASLGRPIYWAGAEKGINYELTQTPDGRVYVRYLPHGVTADSASVYLTVGTYPFKNAYAVTRSLASGPNTVKVHVGNGGIAFYRTTLPTNIYIAYPGSDYQIELFDPIAAKGRQIVASGAIEKVRPQTASTSVPKTAAETASPADLKALSARLGRPVFWAGLQAGSSYELTQTPDGRIYVRYLPAGAKAGSDVPYLTVATYPLANAYATTKQAAKQPGAVGIKLSGGVAFYNRSRPTSVYVAFPGVPEQVEVFDPSAARVHQTVAASKIHAVS